MNPRMSFLVLDGEVYQTHPVDPWAKRRLYVAGRSKIPGREGQRARIRERIAAHGSTETESMRAARAELKRRIAERTSK